MALYCLRCVETWEKTSACCIGVKPWLTVDLQNSVEMKLHVISKWQHIISNLQWIAIRHRISAYFISSWCWFTTCKDPSKHRQFISSIKRSKVLQLSGLFVARCDVVVFPHRLILHILGYKQCRVVNFCSKTLGQKAGFLSQETDAAEPFQIFSGHPAEGDCWGASCEVVLLCLG